MSDDICFPNPTILFSCLAGQVQPASGYAGDVSPQLTPGPGFRPARLYWWMCEATPNANGSAACAGAVPLAWKQWPGMALNAGFDEGLKTA